jgi:tetratricopeptide (TPR) repeat protein
LPVSWALLLALAIWSTVPATLLSRGTIAATAGNWQEASALIDRAARRDPYHAYYHLQSGYAHGIRAEQASDHLAEAIGSYEVGVRRSPNYALNWLNLGALYRQAGDGQEALTCVERAVKLAPEWAVVHLNLGQVLEEIGHQDEAAHHYQRALDGIPDSAHAYFWRTTSCRTHARDSWLKAESARESASAPAAAELWYRTGQRALEVEDYAQALEAFGRALDLKPLVRFYLAKASALEALGRYGEAEENLRTGGFAGAGGKMERARARFALARLLHSQGQSEKAIRTALGAVEMARDPATHLGGNPAHIEYAHYLFHAPAFSQALLPQVTLITVTDEVARWMLELGGWYEEEGNVDEAARLYRELLEAVPDADEARARLEALGAAAPN